MIKKATAAISACILLCSASVAQTPEEDAKIKAGVEVIKLACGTGSNERKLMIDGKADLSVTLRKLPGFEGEGTISYSSSEAQGLVAALRQEFNTEVANLSKAQIDCMKPYADKIFDVLFPPPTLQR
jgi:hypothetical protein